MAHLTDEKAGDQKSEKSLLLTVSQACSLLQVSRAQLYVMANKQHVIEFMHIGRLTRISRASLEAYVESLSSKVSNSGNGSASDGNEAA